jgi:hypothetical protein
MRYVMYWYSRASITLINKNCLQLQQNEHLRIVIKTNDLKSLRMITIRDCAQVIAPLNRFARPQVIMNRWSEGKRQHHRAQ